jgi:hypothetical protein
MKQVEREKKKPGRPKKAVTRHRTTGIRFTKAEHFVITEKAKKAGVKLTTYIREMAINGQVKNRLTDEERGFVRQLIGMSNNLNQVARTCHEEGALTALRYFERYRNEIDVLLKQLRK